MVLEFYYHLASQPCRAVYFLLKLTNVEFEPHVIDLFKGETTGPEFEKINPMHRVPVIRDGDFVLTESVAILRYIATKYDVAEHWYPRKDVRKQARVDEFLSWFHTGIRKPFVQLIITSVRMRVSPGGVLPKIPFDAEKIKELEDGVAKAIKDFDENFLKDKPFICGEEISVADLTGFAELLQLDVVQYSAWKSNKNVCDWMKRVEAVVEAFNEEPTAGHALFKDFYTSIISNEGAKSE